LLDGLLSPKPASIEKSSCDEIMSSNLNVSGFEM